MKLCVAFDMANKKQCIDLAKELRGLDLWIKIGLRSYLRDGATLIKELKNLDNFKIFLDLKLYDIPNTMADACEELTRLEIEMINIHASAGVLAMKELMQRLGVLPKRPLVLAVSALTSFDEKGFFDIYRQNLQEAVINLSKISFEAGLDGMVCSVFESLLIKQNTSENFLTLTPGIRPFKEANDDQKRVADLSTAKANKSDFIVVGRPIYRAENPKKVVEQILEQIK